MPNERAGNGEVRELPPGWLDAVAAEARRWRDHLLDSGPRNNLLFWRELRRGTLDLGGAPAQLFARLLQGKPQRLSHLVPGLAFEDAVRRARVIHKKAREHFEERGLATLHLAVGMATWTNPTGSATPAAPLLLRPVALNPRTPALDDFDLVPEGEMTPNETLLQLLERQFGVVLDRGALDGMLDGEIDTPEEIASVERWVSDHAREVPGFAVAERAVLGTFAYAKLPMVRDLEDTETLAQHDMVAALAGVTEAREAIRERQVLGEVDLDEPDHIPPADEFLVLDADASQNFAINAVTRGCDLVVKGPPGTGKSQTIANLIATLVARGQSVLFVAEKRAAIDAVTGRLDRVGLSDIIFDLHSQAASRRQIAQGLQAALEAVRSTPRPQRVAAERELVTLRAALNEQVEAIHRPRDPWGVSAFEVMGELAALDGAEDLGVRFRGEVLTCLDEERVRAGQAQLERFVSLGGPLTAGDSPWASAAIDTPGAAQAAAAFVDRLRTERLPAARSALSHTLRAAELPPATTVVGWSEYLSLWADVDATLTTLSPECFDDDPRALLRSLGPLESGGLSKMFSGIFSGDFKAARRSLGALSAIEGADESSLFEALVRAGSQTERWQALAPGALPKMPAGYEEAAAAHAALIADLAALGPLVGAELSELSDDQAAALLDALDLHRATLGVLPELGDLARSLNEAGLSPIVAAVGAHRPGPQAAAQSLRLAWASSLMEHLRLSDRAIGAFTGELHSREVERFQRADAEQIDSGADRVRRAYAEAVTAARQQHPDQASLIAGQARRKRGHLPLRQLFRQAPEVLVALKPCWAMSPLLVSQILPADRPYFDVVIFDEASQVTPADAVPSVMRGRRLVIAGDERQLPPTAFFTSQLPEEEDEDISVSGTEGFESVLDALTTFLNSRMLTWHYRSADERLIAFSNVHIYSRSLTTFPGVGGEPPLRHVLAEGSPHEADTDSTSAEVAEVVREIMEHAETRPEESLGVIALGIKHADRIDEVLRRELHGRRDLDEFFAETGEEPFFVKNLERVQGDERDAIILTLGYAKGPDGRLRHHFGPINLEGGERRLNVAVTRAKRRLTLVSAFSHHDLDPNRTSAAGADLLRRYLAYVESGGEDLGTVVFQPPLNAFEIDVRDSLAGQGMPLLAQVGCSGYLIDFAAQHPDRPGEHVLAIECDGASYHSAPTARERDRLRQQVLERLGWSFHRIWSTDWFSDKEGATKRAMTAFQEAVRRADGRLAGAGAHSRAVLSDASSSSPGVGNDMALPGRSPVPVAPGRGVITAYTPFELRAMVRWVDSDTLLRTEEEMVDEVMRVLGFRRRGARIDQAITAAVRAERKVEQGSSGS